MASLYVAFISCGLLTCLFAVWCLRDKVHWVFPKHLKPVLMKVMSQMVIVCGFVTNHSHTLHYNLTCSLTGRETKTDQGLAAVQAGVKYKLGIELFLEE